MELKIDKSALSSILSYQSGIINKKTTIPVLSHGIIEANNESCRIAGTDLDNVLLQFAKCEVVSSGSCTFPAHTLNEIVKRLDGKNEIHISIKNDEMRVVSGKSAFNLSILNTHDFPVNCDSLQKSIVESNQVTKLLLSRDDFLYLIDRTYFSMSVEETRYALNGLYIHSVEGCIRAVATDGHRLSICQVESDQVKNGIHLSGIIVSRKSITEIRKIVTDSDCANVSITISNNQIMFEVDDTVFISKLVDGHFPDYDRAIPYKNEQKVKVKVKDMHSALLRLSSISDERVKIIRMHFNTDNSIVLTSHEQNNSGREEIVANDSNLTKEFSIAFNSRYIIDITSNTHDEYVNVILNEESQVSAIIFASKPLNDSFSVLMPMRV